MSAAIGMEVLKTKGRKIWLVVAVMMAVQLLWAGWAISNKDANDLVQGWMFFLYQFPMLNCIIMPVIAAVVASRLSDVEHKGQTFKLLETIIPAQRIFAAKFIWGSVYMFGAALGQLLIMIGMGLFLHFGGPVPWGALTSYLFFTLVVSLTIYIFQQGVSMLVINQMVPMTLGLVGGFIGLFSMFLPQSFQKLVLWSYYGVLMQVGMNWDEVTRVADFYWKGTDWSGLGLILVFFVLIYGISRILFVRREV
ncbi:ABC transporter permease [Acetobacterium sp. K1/6]|jgi:ABC-type transport system involved in multi-copper enzyme maturation permease subunit|uniref:ABC transporter permease n=1 Tax=Acetobacterium sp. K1/6 TaxID=3055467 RepID=UPI002ACA81BA|nr:ABC transporter permease [Acetobacterium sp. K1/6]MDZ5725416.1 ABC transporter permease [Acetobacterium sp. K1/6]